MATSPDLTIDSTLEPWTNNPQLLTVHMAIVSQIAQATRGTLVLDQVLHSIALQLHNTLQVSGCLFQVVDTQGLMTSALKIASTQHAGKNSTPSFSNVGSLCQYYHDRLTQGKLVVISHARNRFPSALQKLAEECDLCAVLIVPMLHRSYIGGIVLYQCETRREWTAQEIAFVSAIANQLAIAFHQVELEERYNAELKKRQESELALQNSQRRLYAICCQSEQFIGFLAPNGIVLEVNPRVLKFTGLKAHEILGCPFWEAGWWLPTLETIKLQQIIAAAAIGTVIRYELDIQGKNGQVVTVDFTLKPERDETGKVVLLIFEGQDITSYKQAQAALQASETRSRALLEAIPDLIFRVTRHGIYLDWKAAKENTLPLQSQDIIGKHLHQTLPTKVAGLIWHHVELALETNQVQVVEYQLRLNGKTHNYEVRIVRSGLDEAVAIVQDISDRIQSQVLLQQVNQALEIRVAERTAALREANHTLKAEIIERKRAEQEIQLLHSIRQALFDSQDFYTALEVALQKVCEATGWDFGEAWVPKSDGSILECSPAWFSKSERLERFRRASETLTFAPNVGLPGRVWVSQQAEWRRDVSTESNQIYLRAKMARDVGLKAGLGIPLRTPNGVIAVLVFYMFESREEDERLIELISASTELGLMIQRKQAEGEVREALVREKELTELKSRFISMTSHEFRTPLTTILSSAELLEHHSQKWTQQKKLTHLHRIQTSVIHMTKLLNDVLIIGKADAGKLEFNPAPLELEKFCRDLVEELQLNDTDQHLINFTLSSGTEPESGTGESSPLSPAPCLDEKLLRQILENLLSNAIKYSPLGNTVEFTLGYLAKSAVFQIKDQGIGIPTEDQARLFETFHRATNVGTIAGTGLGLAIVKKCVDVHHGQITVESQIGVGTTFTVTLPLHNSVP